MTKDAEILDTFGKFVMSNLRDRAIQSHLQLQDGTSRAPELQPLQTAIAGFSAEQKRIVLQAVQRAIDNATHDLLFALQTPHDLQQGIAVTVDGVAPAAVSDGLHGEMFGDDGWIAKYSSYKPT